MRVDKREFVWEFSQLSCPGQTRTRVESWELRSGSLYESFLNSCPSTYILLACRRLPHSNLDSNCRCGGHPGGTASESWKNRQKQQDQRYRLVCLTLKTSKFSRVKRKICEYVETIGLEEKIKQIRKWTSCNCRFYRVNSTTKQLFCHCSWWQNNNSLGMVNSVELLVLFSRYSKQKTKKNTKLEIISSLFQRHRRDAHFHKLFALFRIF